MAISLVNPEVLHDSADPIETARRIADEVAAPAASAVDRDARFPIETINALRDAKLLGALVPADLGGLDLGLVQVARITELLARRCASSAMVFAMHQIQVACLARHAATAPWFEGYLGELAAQQRLIASVTSEIGVGGDLRSSIASLARDAGVVRLEKRAPTVSYAEHADDFLITARRDPSAPSGDQVLVLASADQVLLERLGAWNTLGMRGTCSPGFVVQASCGADQVVPEPFGDIACRTMVPVSHLFWSAVWLGIATDACARAHRFVRSEAKKTPGVVPPGALRLAEAGALLDTLRARVDAALAGYVELSNQPSGVETLSSVAYATKLNGLKLSASELVVEVVTRALRIVGMAGYREDGELSVARHLRDAHSAALMINNDRIYGANAGLLIVQKEMG
jgi:acyl-CoA dehydrogenase